MSFDDIFFSKSMISATKIDQELNDLFDKEIRPLKPGLFCIVGHKAYHLYRALNERLMRAGFFVGLFTPLVGGEHIIKRPQSLTGIDVYVAVDSINSGEELRTVLDTMSAYKMRVKKVFCYAANSKGLHLLKEQGVISPSRIISIHELSDDKYEEFYKDTLQVYYQSIVEPMDTDHPYRAYVLRGLEKEEFRNIIENCVSEILTKKAADQDKIQAPRNMFAFSFDFVDMDGNIPDDIKNMLAPIELGPESISIRIRAVSNQDLKCSLAVCCQVNLNMRSLFVQRKRICTNLTPICYVRRTGFFVRKGRLVRKRRSPLRDYNFCPLCMSCTLSIILLNRIQECLLKKQKEDGFEIHLVESYVPLE